MTRDELTHDEKVSVDLTVAAILAASAVAYYSEVLGELVCGQCRRESRVMSWQGVHEDALNTIAKDLGLHTCARCEKELR